MDKKASHPTGKEISFNEEHHRYICDGVTFKSATSLVKTFFPEFDKENISRFVAQKRKVPQQQVLEEWESTANTAIIHGKEVHGYIENALLGKDNTQAKLSEKKKECLEKILEEIRDQYDIIEPEKIIFSPELGVSGMIDLFAKKKGVEVYVVGDWKTNKKIEMENDYKSFGSGPFKGMPNSNYHHYSIQVNIYKEILLREGYIPANAKVECIITHIPSIEESFFKNYPALDYQRQVRELLEILRQEKNLGIDF